MNKINYTYSRQRFFSGYDGEHCKICPGIACDGDNVMMSYQILLLSGSDVVYGQYLSKSCDGGKTFCEPRKQIFPADIFKDGIRVTHSMSSVMYNKKHKKWYGLGRTTHYADDSAPVLLPNGVCMCTNGTPLFFQWMQKIVRLQALKR